LAAYLRSGLYTLSRHVHAAAEQQPPRTASRTLVRAKPSDGGFRRNVRGVAATESALAPRLCGVARCDRETRVRQYADGRDRRHPAAGLRSRLDRTVIR